MYPPALAFPKHTPSTPQNLQVSSRDVMFPANINVQPSLLALHMHPVYWPNPGTWEPKRRVKTTIDVNAEVTDTL